MFPIELDNAKVLYYTPQDNYGAIRYPNGEVVDYYHYLAICVYPKDNKYYLFCCNENYEVVSDWLDSSVEKCMEIAASSYKENIRWIKVLQTNSNRSNSQIIIIQRGENKGIMYDPKIVETALKNWWKMWYNE